MIEGPHLTTEGISAAFEEVLPERDQRAADAHLETCERCQGVLDELIRMRRVLHQIGRETPAMPASVQDRLEAVIRSEVRARQESGEPAAHSVARSGSSRSGRGSHRSKHVAPRGRPHSRKGPRSRRSGSGRILAVAATLVVLAVGSLVTYQTVFGGQQDANVATGPSPSASSKPPHDPSAYRIEKKPDLTTQNFAAGVEGVVTTGKPASKPKSTPRFGVQGVTPEECATKAVEDEGGVPLSVASGKFDGADAVLVIAKSKTANSVDAYVVTGCPRGDVVQRATVPISD